MKRTTITDNLPYVRHELLWEKWISYRSPPMSVVSLKVSWGDSTGLPGAVFIQHEGRTELIDISGWYSDKSETKVFAGMRYGGRWEASFVADNPEDDARQSFKPYLKFEFELEYRVWVDPPPPPPPPPSTPTGIWARLGPDAGAVWPTGKHIYFFRGSEYLRYNVSNFRVDPYYPKRIHDVWTGWPSDWDSPGAAVVYPSGKAYFFNGKGDYLRITVTNNSSVDPGYPRKVVGNWGNWPSEDWHPFAAAMWPNGKVYFFSYDEYIRYDSNTHRVDPGYPRKIIGNWPGWPSHWTQINGAVVWPNGEKAYFFRGDEFIRYDIKKRCVEPGFPVKIIGAWKGWPEDGKVW